MSEINVHRKSGISWLPVIIMAILTSIGASVLLYYYRQYETLQQEIAEKQDLKVELNQRVTALTNLQNEFGKAGGIDPPTLLLRYPPSMKVYSIPTFTAASEGASQLQALNTFLDGIKTVSSSEALSRFPTSRDRLNYMINQNAGLQPVLAHFQKQIERMEGTLANYDYDIRNTEATWNQQARQMQNALSKLQSDKTRIERQYQNQARQMQSQVRAKETALKEQRDKREHEEFQLLRRQVELENEIQGIEKQFKPELRFTHTATGQLLDVNHTAGEALINLGSAHGVKPGMRFWVFRLGDYGKVLDLGNIEVTRVSDRTSRVRLTGKPEAEPMAGDLIENPIVAPEKKRPVSFVIAKPFPPLPFNADETAEIVKRWGGVVEDNLTIRTDYLVADDSATDLIEKARQNNVTIISPRVFIKFLGR